MVFVFGVVVVLEEDEWRSDVELDGAGGMEL